MSVPTANIATSTADPVTRYPPGDLAIWIFILAELGVFAVFFAAYAFARVGDVALFNACQDTLDRRAALINTLALITGSYFVVRAVASIRLGNQSGCVRWLVAALGMGLVFLVVKVSEYAHHFERRRDAEHQHLLYVLSLAHLLSLHARHTGHGHPGGSGAEGQGRRLFGRGA